MISPHFDDDYSMAFGYPYDPESDVRQRLRDPNGTGGVPELEETLAKEGGVSFEGESIKITVEGRSNQAMRIVDIRPHIIKKRKPLTGAFFYIPGQDSGVVGLTANLDKAAPIFYETKESSKYSEDPYFEKRDVPLEDGEQKSFVFTVRSYDYYVEYALDFTIRVGPSTETVSVRNGNRPFQITGKACGNQGLLYGKTYMTEQRTLKGEPVSGVYLVDKKKLRSHIC